VLYVGSEPEYQLMHNTQGAVPPACRQTDRRTDGRGVVQVDPAVHCMKCRLPASLASVAALDLTITSDSCTRIREHMQLGCCRMRPQLRSCVPATTWVWWPQE
jgi:hypothetical protein